EGAHAATARPWCERTLSRLMADLKLSPTIQDRLRCPGCAASVERIGEDLLCTRSACAARFPIVDGIPVLLNEARSVFTISDFVSRRDTTFPLQRSRLERLLQASLDLLPDINGNVGTERNYARFVDALLEQTAAPKVLVVGGSVPGQGMTRIT